MIMKEIQWNPSKVDTYGTRKSVHFRGVSNLEGLSGWAAGEGGIAEFTIVASSIENLSNKFK